jgi:uncharacterized membrane protein
MKRVRAVARRVRRDASGAVGPAVAVLGTSLVAAAGLALDVGLYYMGNSDLRSATEAAALAAAMNPAQAQARATDYLVRNGYQSSVLKSVEVGYYCASMWRAAGDRFATTAGADCPGSTVQNAVRIVTGRPSRRFLTGIMGGASPIPELAATASAARIDEAGVSVTSGHLTVTNTLLHSVNNLLGALIGIKLALSTAQIEALMGGNVDAGRFFDALAQRTGQTGTYHEVAQRTYGIGDIAHAAADAAHDPATAAALRVFASAAGNGYRVPLAGLFGLGVWKNMPVGEHHAPPAPPALNARLNAYQLITYAAQAGPGGIDASDLVNLLVPSKPGSTVKIIAAASDAGARPRFSFGPAGETAAGTSMIRLQLEVSAVAAAALPLIVDVAAADASITAIDCANQAEQHSQTRVTVASRSGLVNIYLGKLLRSDAMSKTMPTLEKSDFDFVPLVDLWPIARINAKAVVKPIVGETNASVVFGPGGSGVIGSAEAPGQPVTIGNKAQVGNTLNGLGSFLGGRNGGLEVCLILTGCVLDTSDNALLGAVGGVVSGLGTVLNSTTDPLLDNILAALGVQLGHSSIWVTGARCGVPVLI